MGGEADVTPYLLSRYFGLRSFSTLYGFTWTAYAFAGAIGPILMGRAFDATGSYEALLVQLALARWPSPRSCCSCRVTSTPPNRPAPVQRAPRVLLKAERRESL